MGDTVIWVLVKTLLVGGCEFDALIGINYSLNAIG